MKLILTTGERKGKADYAADVAGVDAALKGGFNASAASAAYAVQGDPGTILEKGKPATPAGGKTPAGYTVKIVGGKRTYVKEEPKKKKKPPTKTPKSKALSPESLVDYLKLNPGATIIAAELAYSFGGPVSKHTHMLSKMVKEGTLVVQAKSIAGNNIYALGAGKPTPAAEKFRDLPGGYRALVGQATSGKFVTTIINMKTKETQQGGTSGATAKEALDAATAKYSAPPPPKAPGLSGGGAPGLAKDKANFAQALVDLTTIRAGGTVENLTEEGAKKNIQGLGSAIVNKYNMQIEAYQKETGAGTGGPVGAMITARDEISAQAKEAFKPVPEKPAVISNTKTMPGFPHGPAFKIGSTLKIGNQDFIVTGISKSAIQGDVRYSVGLRKPKGKTLIFGTLYSNGVWSGLTRMGGGMPHPVMASGERHEVVTTKAKAEGAKSPVLPGLDKSMSGIDDMDDFLEKGRQSTPEGGKTKAGYTVKIVGGKRTYVKDKPKAKSGKILSHDAIMKLPEGTRVEYDQKEGYRMSAVKLDNDSWRLFRPGGSIVGEITASGFADQRSRAPIEVKKPAKKEPAKARGAGEGGKTKAGYTVKIVGGKRTYVKDKPKKDFDPLAALQGKPQKTPKEPTEKQEAAMGKFRSAVNKLHSLAADAMERADAATSDTQRGKATAAFSRAIKQAEAAGKLAPDAKNKEAAKRVIQELKDRKAEFTGKKPAAKPAKGAGKDAGLSVDELAKKPMKWLRTRQDVVHKMQAANYKRAEASSGGLTNPPSAVTKEANNLEEERQRLAAAVDKKAFGGKTKKSMPAPTDLNDFLEKALPTSPEEEEKKEIDKEKKTEAKPPPLPATKKETKMSKSKELTPAKARKILHDKQVHGHPLTDKQRKYMGAVASGTAQKSLTVPAILDGGILEEPLIKSITGGALVKSYYSLKRIDEWTGQFWDDTGLRLESLKCMKESVQLDKERDEFQKTKKSWSERDAMSRAARDALAKKYSEKSDAFNKRDDAISVKMRALEVRLLDYRIKEAQIRQDAQTRTAKSMTDGIDALDKYTLQKSLKYGIHFEVPEGTADGVMGLDDFLEKAQTLPEGSPKEQLGTGEEQGGKVAGKGKTTGSSDSAASPAQKPATGEKKKLSEDDEEVERQLKASAKKKALESTSKSMAVPMHQREMVAHEQAVAVSKLKKGEEYVEMGVGVVPPAEEAAEPVVKARVMVQGPDSLVRYDNQADLACEALMKSQEGSLYSGESPQVNPGSLLINQQVECATCKRLMAKSLSACPHCGTGAVQHQTIPDTVFLEKSQPGSGQNQPGVLRPARREADLVRPNGIGGDSEQE